MKAVNIYVHKLNYIDLYITNINIKNIFIITFFFVIEFTDFR